MNAELNPRELLMLRMLADGLTYRQIARRLFISETSAGTAAGRIYAKLGARTAAHAVNLAWQRGLLGSGVEVPA